jgi:hypothetical protein
MSNATSLIVQNVRLYVQCGLSFKWTGIECRNSRMVDLCYDLVESKALGTQSRKHYYFGYKDAVPGIMNLKLVELYCSIPRLTGGILVIQTFGRTSGMTPNERWTYLQWALVEGHIADMGCEVPVGE